MKKLLKLAKAKTPQEHREICHRALMKCGPHKFKRTHDRCDIDIEIVSTGQETVNGQNLLKVVARAWRDGAEVFVDNPLYYLNPPIMVPDGTFETVDGKQVANFHEDAPEALRQIVLETLKVTALKAA